MAGVDRKTGRPIGRAEHIAQSIEALLTTPRGSRVMRRELGMDYLAEDGRPLPDISPARVERSAHDALAEWEPRIRITTVASHFEDGTLNRIRIHYQDVEDSSEHAIVVRYHPLTP